MIAEGLADAGWFVELAARREPAVDETVAAIGPDRCHGTAVDLTDEDWMSRFVDGVATRHDGVELLVNNAGTSRITPIDGEHTMARWDRVLRLNVSVPFLLTIRLLPLLEASWQISGQRARVVNIGSVDGLRPPEHDAYAYAASKAALHHLTKMLAPKLGPRGVLVNTLAPSIFRGRLAEALGNGREDDYARLNPTGRIGEPADMVGAVLFLASEQSSFVNGAVIPLDGGVANLVKGTV
jgi:NAD(P)-dependent dehydrogenase (short-subunit alcohol dehydrogenase family)